MDFSIHSNFIKIKIKIVFFKIKIYLLTDFNMTIGFEYSLQQKVGLTKNDDDDDKKSSLTW